MVEQNIPLVEHIVNRVMSRLPATHDRDDLVQTGMMGLIGAVQRFDPSATNTFSTYAGRRIEGAIIDQLRRSDWAPRSVRALERQVRSAEDSVGPVEDRDRRVAEVLGMESTELNRLRNDVAKARLDSLDRPTGDQSNSPTIGGSITDSNQGLDERIQDKELVAYVRSAIHHLPERHRIVVAGYFFENRSMTELGDLLGVTQSRASQLKDEALKMMKAGLEHSYGDPTQSEANQPSNTSTVAKRPTKRQRTYNESLAAPRSWKDRIAERDTSGRF